MNTPKNLAMAYSISRKNRKKMAEGGDVQSGKQRSDNEMGVHEASYNTSDKMGNNKPGESRAGATLRHVRNGSTLESQRAMNFVKGQHKSALREMKSMPKPNLYAEGGDVKGVHGDISLNKQYGISEAGLAHRNSVYLPKKRDEAVSEHKRVLSEMQSMKKPNLYASGGKVGGGSMDDGAWEAEAAHVMGQASKKNMSHEEAMGHLGYSNDEKVKLRDAIKKQSLHKYSDGGFAEPEYMDAGDMGDMMMEDMLPEDRYSKEGIINYALGGMAMPESDIQSVGKELYLDDMEDMPEAIRKKYMASGGVAQDNAADDNAIEHLNDLDDLNFDLADNEDYSEMSALKDVGRASDANRGSIGMHADESDHMDMIDRIRKRYMRAAI